MGPGSLSRVGSRWPSGMFVHHLGVTSCSGQRWSIPKGRRPDGRWPVREKVGRPECETFEPGLPFPVGGDIWWRLRGDKVERLTDSAERRLRGMKVKR